MEQVIYSRIEYPIAEGESSSKIFEQFRDVFPKEFREDGAQIGGISVSIRTSRPRAVIFLTYDEEADSYFLLKYRAVPGLIYQNLRKNNL